VLVITFPITGILGRRIGTLRLAQQIASDQRVKLVKELISAIRIVKYYAWETPFAENIAKFRKVEVSRVKDTLMNRAIMLGILINVPAIGMGLTFFIYGFNNTLNVTNVFTSVSLLNLLRLPFTFLPILVAMMSQYAVSFTRIGNFCLSKELVVRKNRPLQDVVLKFTNASFSWGANASTAVAPAGHDKTNKDQTDEKDAETKKQSSSETRDVLKNINLKVKKGEVVMIIGSVGSGKRCDRRQKFISTIIVLIRVFFPVPSSTLL
jgi:ABC-type multidrug transport system fused ATPase/permease subunit